MQPGHGIIIGDKHTFDDWRLVPTQRLSVQPPTPVTKYLSIPGGTDIDLTEAVNGLNYEMRRGSWEFYLRPRRLWPNTLSGLMNCVHGKAVRVILDDDDSWFYAGRIAVNEFRSEEQASFLVLDYCLEPYKYERWSGLEDWMWDPFDFDTGVARDYRELPVDGSMELILFGTRLRVTPVFYSTGTVTLTFGGATYSLTPTADPAAPVPNVFPAVIIGENDETLSFAGSGTVSVDYRGGSL